METDSLSTKKLRPTLAISLDPSQLPKGTIAVSSPLDRMSVSEFINQKTLEMVRSREPADPAAFIQALDSHAFGPLARKGNKR